MGKIAIKNEKIQDIIELKEYILHKHVGYYEEICKWPPTDNAHDSNFDGALSRVGVVFRATLKDKVFKQKKMLGH